MDVHQLAGGMQAYRAQGLPEAKSGEEQLEEGRPTEPGAGAAKTDS